MDLYSQGGRQSNQSEETRSIDPFKLAKNQFFLYLKLFMLMGISWMSECIHVELHGDHTKVGNCSIYTEVSLVLLYQIRVAIYRIPIIPIIRLN